MYYLKLENAEDMGDGRCLVTSNGMTFMVPADMVTTQQQAPSPDMSALLEHIQGLTSHIEGLSQPTNLSAQRVPEPNPTPTAAPDPQAGTRQEHPAPSDEVLESLGLTTKVIDAPFRVNESAPKVNFEELAVNLNSVFEEYPNKRKQVINRIAGMVRSDMMYCKPFLCSGLRRAVLGSIMSRDSLNTSVIPPDLAAFVDDRPLNETLGSRGWDPGSEQAKDSVSSNWMESENVMNKISNEVDDSEFSHMYPNTTDVAIQVNRKFGATEPKQ